MNIKDYTYCLYKLALTRVFEFGMHFYFSSIPGIILWKSLGICVVQLQPVFIAMFASSSLVMFLLLSGPSMTDLNATFIKLLICLQVNRERLLHCFPGDRQTISVIVSEAISTFIVKTKFKRYLLDMLISC